MSGASAKREMETDTSRGKAPSKESGAKGREESPPHVKSHRSGDKKKKMKKVVYYETDSSSPSTSESDAPSVTSKRHERKKFSKIPLRYPRISKRTPLLSVPLGKPQVDLDELDDEEAPCVALRNMFIGEVCPKESEEPTQAQDQPSSSMQASPPTQDEDQAQDDENEDQEEPPQEEDNDQGGDEVDQDKEDDQGPRPPHPRVHQAIQRDHPVNSILDGIHKGVTTRSRVAHFCEHYSFVSSIEPYRVDDAPRDSDWVLAMQEELNNFTRNEVWHLVPHPNQNIVGTKWVFRNKQDGHGVVTGTKPDL
jgi:hypothetical protein